MIAALLDETDRFRTAQAAIRSAGAAVPGTVTLLICRRCGRAVEVTGGPGLLEWVERTAAEHGHRDVGDEIEITGTCPGCARRATGG